MLIIREWVTNKCTVREIPYDFDLNRFIIVADDRKVFWVTPDSIEAMKVLIHSLNNGACPISDNWTDDNDTILGSW